MLIFHRSILHKTASSSLTVFLLNAVPVPSSGQRLSNDDCLEDKKKDYQNCMPVVHSDIHTYGQFLKLTVGLDLGFL